MIDTPRIWFFGDGPDVDGVQARISS